jgi:transcriptional regulator with XRE-family HTH domain
MDMRKLVGRNFERLRQAKGLTQEDVSARSGFSQQYLSGLERGIRNPTVITLYELASALGVSHLDLVAVDEKAPSTRRPTTRKVPRAKD